MQVFASAPVLVPLSFLKKIKVQTSVLVCPAGWNRPVQGRTFGAGQLLTTRNVTRQTSGPPSLQPMTLCITTWFRIPPPASRTDADFGQSFPGPTQRPTARDLDRGARARVGRSLARRAMRTDDAEDDEEIETLSTPPSGEQGPAEHAVQTRPDAGGRSLQSLLQSLVPARLQTTQNVPDSPSRHSDMIEEPTQTQGECEAAPDAGAPVLRSAQDDLVNALPVTGREWAYSSRGGGR